MAGEEETDGISSNLCCVPFFDKHVDGYNVPPKKQTWLHRCCRNRWARATVCCVATFICVTPYNNWTGFSGLLYRDNVYSWLCTPEELAAKKCPAQTSSIGSLFFIASGFEYSVGVLAGVVYDFFGPRCCGLLGMATFLLGLVLLMISSQSVRLYFVSMVFLGSSANVVAFPGLILGNLFSSTKNVALTILMACQLGSSLVPIVMMLFWNLFEATLTFRKILFWYTFAAVFPCIIGYFFFLPCRRIPDHPDSKAPVNPSDCKAPLGSDVNHENESSQLSSETTSFVAPSIGKENSPNSSLELCAFSSVPGNTDATGCNGNITRSSAVNDVEEPPIATDDSGCNAAPKGNFKQLRRELCTLEVHLFTLYYIIQVTQYLYFPTAVEDLYGQQMLDLAGKIALLQIVFAVGFAFIVDYVGTLSLCYLLTVFNLIIYSGVLGNWVAPIFFIVLNNIGYSFVFTSKYTYLGDNYSGENFGQLIGYVSLTSGAVAIGMAFCGKLMSYKHWAIMFVVTSVLSFFILLVLSYRTWKKLTPLLSRTFYNKRKCSTDPVKALA